MLPTSGKITIKDIMNELGISSGSFSLNDSQARTMINKPSGAISLKDFYGASVITFSHTVDGGYGLARPMTITVSNSKNAPMTCELISYNGGYIKNQNRGELYGVNYRYEFGLNGQNESRSVFLELPDAGVANSPGVAKAVTANAPVDLPIGIRWYADGKSYDTILPFRGYG